MALVTFYFIFCLTEHEDIIVFSIKKNELLIKHKVKLSLGIQIL